MALLSAYALYVVALNVFLSTSLFEQVMDQDPETLLVTYERGWTVWPGTIHARKLSIRSQDSHVQLMLRVDRCEFDISFLDLARQKFHPTRVVGSGVTFDARQRIDGPLATPEYVDAIPSIAGFERIPFKPAGPHDESEKWDDRHYHLWTVHLENVTAKDVRRIWIDTGRFEGGAMIAGGFYLKPVRKVHIGPIHADIASGKLTVKGLTMVEPLAGTLDTHVSEFDPRDEKQGGLLEHVSLATDLRARVPDLANVPRTLTGPARLAGAADLRRAAVRIEGGKLVKDTHLDISAPGLRVHVPPHRAGGDVALRADIPDEAGPARLVFRIDARALQAGRVAEGDEAVLFTASAVDVTGDTTALDLARPFTDLHVVAVVPRGELPDARAFGPYVPPDASVRIVSGHARAELRLEVWLAEHKAKGDVRLEADDLDLGIAKARVRGSTRLDTSVDAWRWQAMRVEGVNVKVHVAQGAIASDRAPDVRVVDVKGLDVAVDAPQLDLDDPMRAFHAKVDMPDAEIVDRGLLRNYLPKGQEMELAKGHARFDARCELDVEGHRGRGTIDLHSRRLGFTFAALDLLADVKAHARVHDWDWERGDLSVDRAEVDVTKVTATRHGAARSALAIPRIALGATSRRFAFSDPLGHLELSGSISDGELTDPVALDAFMPAGATVLFDTDRDGARFDARLVGTVERHVARGTLSARGNGIGLRGEKVRVRGDVDATAEVAQWRLDEGKLRLESSRITITKAAARFGDSNRADGGREPELEAARSELQAKTGELDIAHPTLAGVDYHFALQGAHMDDATKLSALFSKSDAVAFAVESGRVRADADVTVTPSARTASGGAKIVLEKAGARFHETHLSGDFEVVATVKGFDRDRDGIDISGSQITMRNVHAAGAAAETSAWNGDLQLLQGLVRASASPAFDGFAQLHADNAKPLLAMVLGKSVPKLVVGLVTADGLSGQARITVEPGRAAIREAHVRGDDVVVYGDYVVAGDHVRGAVVVAKGPLSAGVKVDDQGTHVRLFDLEGWRKDERHAALALFAQGEVDAKAKAKARAAGEQAARERAAATARTATPR